ncbi:uncharacterized protein LOC144445114 [Glandiceps talaboti]
MATAARRTVAPGRRVAAQANRLQLNIYKVDTVIAKQYQLDNGSTVYDLMTKIKEENDLEEDVEIMIFERAVIKGSISRMLENNDLLSMYQRQNFVYHVRGVDPDLSDLVEISCNQNIAFFGPPGHGKSSAINSIAKSLGYLGAIATTFRGGAPGTRVYTRYRIDERDLSFTLWDVPGQSLTAGPLQLARILEDILNGRQPAGKRIGRGIRRTKRDERIHAVVCVQNATANVDVMHSVILNTVVRPEGRSVPIFLIMTHADELIAQHQLDADGMDRRKDDFARTVGLDACVTFCIANDMHQFNIEDPQREQYIREMLLGILSSAKVYKRELESSDSWCTLA